MRSAAVSTRMNRIRVFRFKNQLGISYISRVAAEKICVRGMNWRVVLSYVALVRKVQLLFVDHGRTNEACRALAFVQPDHGPKMQLVTSVTRLLTRTFPSSFVRMDVMSARTINCRF